MKTTATLRHVTLHRWSDCHGLERPAEAAARRDAERALAAECEAADTRDDGFWQQLQDDARERAGIFEKRG